MRLGPFSPSKALLGGALVNIDIVVQQTRRHAESVVKTRHLSWVRGVLTIPVKTGSMSYWAGRQTVLQSKVRDVFSDDRQTSEGMTSLQ